MENITEFDAKMSSYEKDLQEMINSSKGFEMLVTGIIVTLITGGVLAYISSRYNCDCDRYTYAGIVISILLILVSIICFLTYKSIKQKQAKLQEEKILLRDLCIAIEVSEKLPDNFIKSETSKEGQKHEESVEKSDNKYEDRAVTTVACKVIMQEKIIQTLLSRYAN